MKCPYCKADLEDSLGYFAPSEVRYHLFLDEDNVEFGEYDHEDDPFGKLYCENCGKALCDFTEEIAHKILSGETVELKKRGKKHKKGDEK